MGATKMAPIKIVVGDKELDRIESQDIMRVLVVEDDPNVRENTVRKLEERGCRVDAYATPREAAEMIEPYEHQLVIVDIRFAAPNISGDDFIYKNKDIFEEAKIVAFTGFDGDIVHRNIFDEIFKKGQGINNRLFDYAEDTYHERQKHLAKEIKKRLVNNEEESERTELLRARDEVLKVLKETKDKNEKILWYKGRDFSVNDLIVEIEDEESEVGRDHIRMMREWLSQS
jgi:DNA-binding NtrC family response regulator